MQALQIAASGMMAQQYNTEVVANNLANMNTTGYQRRRTEFSDLLYKVSERKDSVSSRAGISVPAGLESGQGVRLAAVYRVSEQGSLSQTSNTFDIAIQGKGYFQVLLPNGDTAYSRDGTIYLTRRDVLMDGNSIYGQRSVPLIVHPEDSANLDTPEDWAEAEARMRGRSGPPG